RLKSEVAAILKTAASGDDFKTAKYKISELQQRMEDLRNTNLNVQQENARLKKMLAQMNQPNAKNSLTISREPAQSQPGGIATFTAAEMNLVAVKPEITEEDVFNTQRNIMGSFALKHTINFDNSEVWVVVTQPDGKVLQKSAWESGSFTSAEGKKIYSLKMTFGYTKGEAKKLNFTITTEKFQRGNYTMQIYNNGIIIGRFSKMLT
ncbi:MAG: hypothetical protein ABIP80_04925, partial [Ferruginibacter sp.]